MDDDETRILRPLCLFGLLEFRSIHGDERIPFEWRKMPLFDRFLTFEIDYDGRTVARH